MSPRIFFVGKPKSFETFPKSRIDDVESSFRVSSESNIYSTEIFQLNDGVTTYYVYRVNNVLDVNGRENSFFSIYLELDGFEFNNWEEKHANLLEFLFVNIVVEKAQILKYIEAEQAFKYLKSSFEEVSNELRVVSTGAVQLLSRDFSTSDYSPVKKSRKNEKIVRNQIRRKKKPDDKNESKVGDKKRQAVITEFQNSEYSILDKKLNQLESYAFYNRVLILILSLCIVAVLYLGFILYSKGNMSQVDTATAPIYEKRGEGLNEGLISLTDSNKSKDDILRRIQLEDIYKNIGNNRGVSNLHFVGVLDSVTLDKLGVNEICSNYECLVGNLVDFLFLYDSHASTDYVKLIGSKESVRDKIIINNKGDKKFIDEYISTNQNISLSKMLELLSEKSRNSVQILIRKKSD